ncbi:MAG: hypothetical protein GTO17_13305 [Candidatus Aminicenantes bacterium]|nr:hypothetical protein [Candidatus Aminicenantes bacterium]
MKFSIVLCLFFASVFNFNVYGQVLDHEHEEHKHHLGFLLGSVYNITEEKYMLGLGFEYEYVLPLLDRLFGIGFASEVVFDEHKHYVVSLLIPIHPTRELTLFVAPGIMFIDKEEIERRFAIHFGIEYEFDLEKIFLAPEFEIAFAEDDIHIMLGIHIGFGF